MRITESQLRRIIKDEAKKFKRGKRVNESLISAQENLHNAMHEFYSEMANQSDHEQALIELQNEMMDFVEEYR